VGLPFSDAESLIKGRLATALRNARYRFRWGACARSMLFVLGAVARPGKMTLNGYATAFNALYAAGGPNRSVACATPRGCARTRGRAMDL